MKIRYKILLLTSVMLTFALAARAADLSGKWKAEFETQVGVQK